MKTGNIKRLSKNQHIESLENKTHFQKLAHRQPNLSL